MTIARCAYCGALAERPVRLGWFITGESDDDLGGSLPLCVECSRSWCPEAPTFSGKEETRWPTRLTSSKSDKP